MEDHIKYFLIFCIRILLPLPLIPISRSSNGAYLCMEIIALNYNFQAERFWKRPWPQQMKHL